MNKGVNFQLSATNNAQGAFTSFNKGLQSVNQAANTNRVLMRSMNAGLNTNRRAVQQLGFQMTDFAVQVAGGQSAMLAFVQQGGQMLQFFGPFGAIMAALLAVFGSLYIGMTKTGVAIDQLYPYLGVLEEEFRMLVDAIKAVIGVAADMGIWIVHNLDLIIITALVAVGSFGVQWVAAMIAAAAATFTFVGALVALRSALMLTGVGALIVLAGFLVERFLTLARGAGGLGNAMIILGEMGQEAFDHLRWAFEAVGYAIKSVWFSITAVWVSALATMQEKWAEFLRSAAEASLRMSEFVPAMRGAALALHGAAVEAQSNVYALDGVAESYRESARAAQIGAEIVTAANQSSYESLEKMRKVIEAVDGVTRRMASPLQVAGTLTQRIGQFASGLASHYNSASRAVNGLTNTLTAAAKAAWDLAQARLSAQEQLRAMAFERTPGGNALMLYGGRTPNNAQADLAERNAPVVIPDIGGGGGGGGAVDRAKEDAEKIKTVFDDMQKSISGSLLSSFKALTNGSKSFAEAALDVLSNIADKIIDILATPIFDSLAGGIARGLGGIIPGLGASFGLPSFEGGGNTGMGVRAGGLDGRGGRLAILHPDETVLDHTKGQGTGGQPIVVNMTINSPDAESFRKSRGQIEAEIARAVQSGARNR